MKRQSSHNTRKHAKILSTLFCLEYCRILISYVLLVLRCANLGCVASYLTEFKVSKNYQIESSYLTLGLKYHVIVILIYNET